MLIHFALVCALIPVAQSSTVYMASGKNYKIPGDDPGIINDCVVSRGAAITQLFAIGDLDKDECLSAHELRRLFDEYLTWPERLAASARSLLKNSDPITDLMHACDATNDGSFCAEDIKALTTCNATATCLCTCSELDGLAYYVLSRGAL